jgi:N-acetylmuramoyl-L-alanine amidase
LNDNQTRVVIETSAPAALEAELFEAPDRIEVKVPGAQWDAPGFTPGGLSSVREFSAIGDRITLLLREKVTVAEVFMLAPEKENSYRLVMDLQSATPAQYAMKLNQVVRLNMPLRAAIKTKTYEKPTQVLVDKKQTNNKSVIKETPSIRQPAAKTEVAAPKKTPVRSKKPLVVIDAGHGGQDPGALGRGGIREKDITLGVAKKLRDALVASNEYRVVMVRDKDVYLKLADRVRVGQRNKADLFISLHADSVGENSDPEITRGASIYTISDKASDQVSARLAARENKADLIGGKPDLAEGAVGGILLDLLNQETMMRSKELANAVANGFEVHEILMLRRPLRSAGFAVLKGEGFPSILIEMGFLSSDKDGNLLQQKDYQAKLARAIKAGVDNFFANDKLAGLSE